LYFAFNKRRWITPAENSLYNILTLISIFVFLTLVFETVTKPSDNSVYVLSVLLLEEKRPLALSRNTCNYHDCYTGNNLVKYDGTTAER
jgi:hypothetical protein